MTEKVNLIVAMCNNRGIGIAGKLPWRLKKDMEFFKKITSQTINPEKQNAVIMGRKTWFSIPEKFRPLAKRINIILSREMKQAPEGTHLASSFSEAIQLVQAAPLADKVESVHVIGGASVYKEAMESCDQCRLYLTRVLSSVECDTYLPEFEDKFRKIERPSFVPEGEFTENGLDFVFEVYEKISEAQSVA
ncbi:dihydrofolate reductase-like [Liolophura sinensis]|uniref:dihydrofolate reductase-like n=1 Tax=Liolophura sinensis TaxID=3198878 RepID=UPI00315826EC